jgi:hypothetical protein
MATFIAVYQSGVVVPNEIGSYEFVGMKKETFLLNEIPTHANVVCLVCELLGWMDEDCEVRFEGRVDIGMSNDPWMKTISPVWDEKEWKDYVTIVMKSEVRGIELVARMVAHNDVSDERSRLSTLPEVVDEQDVESGILLTQPWQETQDDTIEEPPFIASNKTVEWVCGSASVGDVLPDTGFISGVDPQPIALGVDPSFVELENKAVFGDEHAEDIADDRPVPELSKRDKVMLH